METPEIVSRIRAIVNDEAKRNTPSQATLDGDITSVIDSMSVVNVIVRLEEEFGVSIDDSYLFSGFLESVEDLANHIQCRQ